MSFEIGDKIRVLTSNWLPKKGTVLTVVKYNPNTVSYFDIDDNAVEIELFADMVENIFEEFELVEKGPFSVTAGEPPQPAQPMGVYRPNLEDRKSDKVRVELVDLGFPNALWAVAEVMTWAQNVKGYKDHDWKNLPKEDLAAAASRHRQEQNKGHLNDHESNFLHKAHEAFGVLAELELMLTGK